MRSAMYGSYPSLGNAESAAQVAREDMARFHKLYCAPNNTVLVVSGAVIPETVKQLAEEAYGQVPSNPEAGKRVRPQPQLTPQVGERIAATEPRVKQGALVRMFAVPSRAIAQPGEAEALEVLAQILNSPGHLMRPAVGDARPDMVAAAGCNLDSLAWSEFTFATNDRDPETSGPEIAQIVEDIRANGVAAAELKAAQDRLTSDHVNAGYEERSLAARYFAVAVGVPVSRIEGRAAAIAKVTAEDVKKVAAKYLDPQRAVTGWLLPEAVQQLDEAV
jgi:zinc protease